MLKRIKTNPIEKEQEEILWDRFQEFRLDKNIEIYYIRAEIENLSFDLVRLDKEDKIKNGEQIGCKSLVIIRNTGFDDVVVYTHRELLYGARKSFHGSERIFFVL